MTSIIRIAGICGSLRKESSNKKLLLRAQQLCSKHVPEARIDIIDWNQLPVYNEDLEEDPPKSVLKFKEEIGDSDAILFATPGPLKNAIDWASRTKLGNRGDVFAGKPVAIIGAGPGSYPGASGSGRAQLVLRQTLVVLNMVAVNMPSVMLTGSYKAFKEDGSLESEVIEEKIVQILKELVNLNNRLKITVPKPTDYGMLYINELLETKDGVKIRAYVCKRIEEDANTRPTVLMLHGSGGNMGHRLPIAESFYKNLKCNVMLVSYRGYGRSDGTPSENGLRLDAQAALDYIRKDNILKDTKVIVYGQALGGAVAIDLVSRNESKVDALIIENTFLSIPKVIPHIVPSLRYLTFICSEIWPSDSNITKLRSIPILFLSGSKDELIPPQHMKILYELANTSGGKMFQEIENGSHYDTVSQPEYFSKIGEFFTRMLGEELYEKDQLLDNTEIETPL
ncbi:4645_t:CDS:10 [Scutellospora calospora]|uniref:4645_t:CDS:1 n=1 Tax=Scutellospora calospora TaxID=85575 RepID=A0ACA9L2P7_9GLOM|nr:4645_t:CDS:10 [Scutellospora calospora]